MKRAQEEVNTAKDGEDGDGLRYQNKTPTSSSYAVASQKQCGISLGNNFLHLFKNS